jgi:hypothetical protein
MTKTLRCLLLALLLCPAPLLFAAAGDASDSNTPDAQFPRPVASYEDGNIDGIGGKLWHRAKAEPFNILATAIFFCAIAHTFLAGRFMRVAHRYQHASDAMEEREKEHVHGAAHARMRDRLLFRSHLFHFLGEVEAVFGVWLIPLALAIIVFKGWDAMVHYVSATSFAEPVFVVVVMAIAASRPVLRLAETLLAKVAALGGGSPAAWWFAILTAGPLLGSFITEPAAMTICALLLGTRIYALKPSAQLSYATLGLLFVNISVGGTLTHFAAPPVVMVARTWDWGIFHMLGNFGWKAAVGIVAANALYFLKFRRELSSLKPAETASAAAEPPVPLDITLTHLGFIAWTVVTSHYPPLVVIGFLFFLAFVQATERHQDTTQIRGPMLVGFFLASLIIHGGCQQWWIAPVIGGLARWPLMIGSTALTALNDNAAITYLASLVPGLSDPLKYAVVAGAVTGGGLTVIANAPNPAGQSLLQKYFGDAGISPLGLFLAALAPTAIMGAVFMLL